jgi:alkylation response protein AidB-like acyl-CoA dehydrogenase
MWTSPAPVACTPQSGGQGLPQLLNMALFEMQAAANRGGTPYSGLLHGACKVALNHTVPELRERFLVKLWSGDWLGTLCLTEPQAGVMAPAASLPFVAA